MNFENGILKQTKNDEIEYIQFKKLLAHKEVNHAYILKTNDMNFRVGKDFRLIEQVKNNLKIMCNNLDFDYTTIIRPDYNHSANVSVVDFVKYENDEPDLRGERFINTDGLISNRQNITLMSTNADCCLILLYDPVKKVIGNIHAGWRGTFGKIALNAVNEMIKNYNSNPKDIEAYLCPSIRKCHFEVDTDVEQLCANTFEYTNRLDDIILKGDIKEGKQKYYIDNILINKILLKEAGICEENIIDSGICSVCSQEKIHSKRAEGFYFGLGGAFIAKK